MAKWRVFVRSIDYGYVDIEADTKEKAIEAADELDGGEYHFRASDCSWELDDAYELDDDQNVDYTYDDIMNHE